MNLTHMLYGGLVLGGLSVFPILASDRMRDERLTPLEQTDVRQNASLDVSIETERRAIYELSGHAFEQSTADFVGVEDTEIYQRLRNLQRAYTLRKNLSPKMREDIALSGCLDFLENMGWGMLTLGLLASSVSYSIIGRRKLREATIGEAK